MVKTKKSQVFVIVLVVLVMVTALGGVFLQYYTRTKRDITDIQTDKDKAYSLARSGLTVALRSGSCDRMDTTVGPVALGEGSLSYSIRRGTQSTDDGLIVTSDITATGTCGKSTQEIQETNRAFINGWAKRYGLSGEDYVIGLSFASDGGYIIGGSTNSSGAGSNDFLLMKIDSAGNFMWGKTYGTSSSERIISILPVADGGYILLGDSILLKVDQDGVFQWGKFYANASLRYIQKTDDDGDGFADDGYILGGYSTIFTNSNFCIAKVNLNGEVQWAGIYGTTSTTEFIYSLAQTDDDGDGIVDDGFILAGRASSFGAGNYEFFLVKVGTRGVFDWARAFGGTNFEQANFVAQDTNRDYLLGGFSSSFGAGEYDGFLVKVTQNGDYVWAKKYGDSYSNNFLSFRFTSDGGYVLAGVSQNNFLLVKVDDSENYEWAKLFKGPSYEAAFSVLQTQDNGYILGGDTWSFGAIGTDALIVKTNSEGMVDCCAEAVDASFAGNQGEIITGVTVTNVGAPSLVLKYYDPLVPINDFTIDVSPFSAIENNFSPNPSAVCP